MSPEVRAALGQGGSIPWLRDSRVAVGLGTSHSFEEFADKQVQRRGHPLHTLDPEYIEANGLTFAPAWAEVSS